MEAAQIWQELAPHYSPTDCFGGSSNLAGTGSTLFWRIVSKAAQIWWELAPHYFPTDCFEDSLNLEETGSSYFSNRFFGGSSNLEGTGSTLFFDRLFCRLLKFGGNWLHIIFRGILLEIWRELTPHYITADCFGGSLDLAGTESTLISDRLFWRQLKFGGNWLHIIF